MSMSETMLHFVLESLYQLILICFVNDARGDISLDECILQKMCAISPEPY